MVTRRDSLILAGLVLLGTALRAYHLGEWSFEADEIYTLRDSVVLRPTNPRPLMYILTHYLVLPFAPPNEISLRFLPALFGILGIPALYLLVRRTINARAALFAALLLALSPLHIARSQYARYWTLIFILAAFYPLAVYLAVHERKWRWLVAGLVASIAATLAHPSGGLLLGGVVLWLAVIGVQEPWVREVLSRPRVRLVAGLLLAIGAAAIIVRFGPLLTEWVATPQRALQGPALLMSYVDGLTAALVLTGAAGIVWLWLDGQRSLALLLASVVVVPVAFLFLVSLRGAVLTAYLFATSPVYFIGAGVFLDRLAGSPIRTPARQLLVGTYLLLLLAAAAPLLISHYRDGGRADFRTVAEQLRTELRPGDAIVADEFPVLQHYLGQPVDTLKRDPGDLVQEAAQVQASDSGRALWVVALTSKRGGFNRRKFGLGPMADWLFTNCQLRSTVGVPRLDYRQNEIQTFRCPPLPASASSSP